MKKLTIILLFLVIMTSCSTEKASNVEVVEIPESIKSDAIELSAKIVPFAEPHLYVYKYFVYNDSLLLVCNMSSSEEKAIKVYTYPELEFISDFIPFGRGPGELLSAGFAVSGDKLVVDDQNVRYNFIIPIDSLLNEDYTPLYNNHGIQGSIFAEYSKDSLVGNNPNYFSDDERGIGNDAERLVLLSKTNELGQESVFGKHKYYAGNVSYGSLITNQDKKVIVYAGAYFPDIEIYDYDLNLKKIVRAPGEFKYSYSVDAKNNWIELNHTIFCFSDLFNTDDYFYASYIGSYYKGGDVLQGNYESLIFKLDWDGNLIETYKYDKRIFTFTVSTDGNTFYATVLDDEDSSILVELTAK